VDAIEEADGGLAMFVNGAQGDANPATAGDFEEARRMGEAAGQGAQILAAVNMISEQGVVARGGRPHVPTRVAALEMGPSLRGMTVPGEATTRLGLPLKEALGSPYRLFLGPAYDTLGYLIPADEWMTGRNNDYEESVSMGSDAGAAIGAAFLELMSQGQAHP
jgi:hypothetical protein